MDRVDEPLEARPLGEELLAEWPALLVHRRQEGNRRVLDVANAIWCTGFHPGFSWIDLPVFDPDGEPRHDRGVVADQPGLFFVGLHFQYAFSSTMIHGVGRDAARIADAVAARQASRAPARPQSSAA